MMNIRTQKATVLIMALWSLSFLTVMVLTIGLGTRQKITMLQRLESRSQVHSVADAGVKKSISFLVHELERAGYVYTSESKRLRHNNPKMFSNQALGDHIFSVFYGQDEVNEKSFYGVVDEERKININFADHTVLRRLFADVLEIDESEAGALAKAIYDWRQFGESQAQGFYSDDYYGNLEYPYSIKNDIFEVTSELLLVKGFNRAIYEKIEPFITVYGDGMININTASAVVLRAIGFEQELIEKIMQVRKGPDEREATDDDHIFQRTYDIAAEVNRVEKLKKHEVEQIDYANIQQMLTTNSFFYSIHSVGRLSGNRDVRTIDCVFDITNNMIKFWHEK